MVLPPQGRGTGGNDCIALDMGIANPNSTFSPKSLSTTRCSRGSMSARGMGPRNRRQAGTKSILETKMCGCGQETSHVLSAAATQAAPEPPGFGWSRVNSCSCAGTHSACSCKNKAVLPPSARCCLGLQRRKLKGGGRGEAGRGCDLGIAAPCSFLCESRVPEDFKKRRSPIFLYKKAATFYCSKNTHYTRSLMNKTNYSSQRKFKTQHTAWEQTDIQL